MLILKDGIYFEKISNPIVGLLKEEVRSKWKLLPGYKLGYLYNEISKIYGYKNWNAFSAFLKKKESNV